MCCEVNLTQSSKIYLAYYCVVLINIHYYYLSVIVATQLNITLPFNSSLLDPTDPYTIRISKEICNEVSASFIGKEIWMKL